MDKTTLAALAKPFTADKIRFKIQAKLKSDPNKGLIVAYIDARDVMERLDEVLGTDWSDSYREVVLGSKTGIECSLTLDGVTRSDVGDPESDGMDSSMKSGYSDAFKRAAVKFGVGRFLYSMPKLFASIDGNKISESELPRLQKVAQAFLDGKYVEDEKEVAKERVWSIEQMEAVVSFGAVSSEEGLRGGLVSTHEEAKALLDLSALPEDAPLANINSWLKVFTSAKGDTSEACAKEANVAYNKARAKANHAK